MRAKNILFVYPVIPQDTYWSFSYSMSLIDKKAAMPPLGAITVAAMLPRERYQSRLVDENVLPLQDQDLEWADAVFISAMQIQAESLARVATRAKEFRKVTVAGGPYPTQFYDTIADIDHFVLGDAEETLHGFLHDFERGQAKHIYMRQAIRHHRDDAEIDHQEFERVKAAGGNDCAVETMTTRVGLAETPVPRFDLLDLQAYGSMSVQFSRGCPHRCDFCTEPLLFGSTTRTKDAGQMLAEFRALYELGWRGAIFIVDDNLIGNRKRLKDMLKPLIAYQQEHHYPFSLYSEMTVLLARDAELMEMMRDAGFSMGFFGIETPDPVSLAAAGKNHNNKVDLDLAMETIQSYGMEVTAGFIVGMEKEPADISDLINDFCERNGIATAMAGLLTVAKGSLLHRRLLAEDRLLATSVGDNTHKFTLDFIPNEGRTANEIINQYRRTIALLYSPSGANYFRRCKMLLRRIGYSPTFTRDPQKNDYKSFIRLLWKVPCSRYGINSARFLLHSLAHHPRLFPEAVRLCITGYHATKITSNALLADSIYTRVDAIAERYRATLQSIQEKGASTLEPMQAKARQWQVALGKLRNRARKLPAEHKERVLGHLEELLKKVNAVFK